MRVGCGKKCTNSVCASPDSSHGLLRKNNNPALGREDRIASMRATPMEGNRHHPLRLLFATHFQQLGSTNSSGFWQFSGGKYREIKTIPIRRMALPAQFCGSTPGAPVKLNQGPENTILTSFVSQLSNRLLKNQTCPRASAHGK